MQSLLQKTLIHSLYMGLTYLRCAAAQSLERAIEVIEGGAALLFGRAHRHKHGGGFDYLAALHATIVQLELRPITALV